MIRGKALLGEGLQWAEKWLDYAQPWSSMTGNVLCHRRVDRILTIKYSQAVIELAVIHGKVPAFRALEKRLSGGEE